MRQTETEVTYLIHLLSSILKDKQPDAPPEYLDWESLYRLAVWHGVSNIACYAIKHLVREKQPPQDIFIKFQNDCKKAMAREAVQYIALEQLLEAFEAEGILSIPMKGSVLKYLYPSPDMRLMADIDILYHVEQKAVVRKILKAQNYSLKAMGGNHDVYYRQPYMSIEMHHMLVAKVNPYSDYLEKTWNRARLKTNCQSTYELPQEDFFIYLLLHLNKHYIGGGTGIRSFMDIWVYREHYKNEMNWEYIHTELNALHLREFSDNVLGLCDVWFGHEKSSGFYGDMAQYVVLSGTYGTRKHSVVSSLGILRDKKKPMIKLTYLLHVFFPPIEIIKNSYPLLKAWPFLLPVCWVLRGITCLAFKHSNTFQRMKEIRSVTREDIIKMENLHRKTGL